MTKLINCGSSEALGYPAYFRAVYTRWAIVKSLELETSVNKIAKRMQESPLAIPLNDPTPVATDLKAVLRLQVLEGAGTVTVAHLANALLVPPVAWGLVPDYPIDFESLERISQADAYDDAANRVIIDQPPAPDALTSLEHILELILALVVVGLIVWGTLKLRGLLKNV